MEEILASIKRVIRDDGRASLPPRSRAPSRAQPIVGAAPADDEGELVLDDPIDGGVTLVSDDAAAASRQSLAALNAVRPAPAPGGEGGALELAVRDMLRPLLKDWLDQHLPQLVEELVTREIARITGRDL